MTDLIKIENCASKWLVDFNPLKTNFINISLKRNKSKLCIKFKGENVLQVTEHKHLGMIFSDDMKWQKHISYVTAKASQRIGQMYRSSIHLNKKQLCDVYLKMIRPIIEYGSVLYDNCSFADSIKLEKLQRRAALICTGAMRRTETVQILGILEWQTLEARRKEQKFILFFKIFNNLTPLYLRESMQCKVNAVILRNIKPVTIIPLKSRLNCYGSSFFPVMIKEWNNLSCEITDMADLKCFKTALSKHTNPNYNKSTDCPMFHFCTGFYGRILTQMKLGLSKLNHHLFLYNITDNPFCPSCLDSVEDVEHYFLKCSTYEDAR